MRSWAGNVTYRAARVHRPESVAQLRQLVADARGRVRALGTGHSFSRVADTTGALIATAGLPPHIAVDHRRQTVTVAAGVRYGELAGRLHEAGFALPGMASLPHISVAGACATGTHGSGDGVGGLATSVSALDLVTADGELRTVDRHDPRLPGVVVGLGALGVVTSLTLDLVPTFALRQDVYEQLPFEVLVDRFDEVFASAYSVSVFTCWRGPYAEQVWRKRRDGGPAPERWLGARLADGPRHPVPGGQPVHCTEQGGVTGPWHTRLPHFRLDFTPSAGNELQSEYLLPRERAGEALVALAGIRGRLAPVVQVSEVRTVAADQLWLSPSYRRHSVAIHFTWVADEAAVAGAVAAVERRLAPLGARPHWGKLSGMDPQTVRSRYPRAADFADLRHQLDPDGRFGNDFVDAYFPTAGRPGPHGS